MLASLVTSLHDLTPLIIALLVAGLLLIFRPQIVQLVGRLTSLHAHVGRVEVEAALTEPSARRSSEEARGGGGTFRRETAGCVGRR